MLFNTNLFVDGINFKGDVPSLSLPKLVVKTDEYRGGGMAGPVEMDMGLEKMEASFTTNGVRREAMKFWAVRSNRLQRGLSRFVQRAKGQTTAVVATLRGMLKELDPGDWKPGDKAEFKYSIAVSYYKLEIAGRLIYEIDMVASIRVIDGVDQLASMRSDLGL